MSYTLYSVPCTDKTKLILTALNSDQKETRSIMGPTDRGIFFFKVHCNFSEMDILKLRKHSSTHGHSVHTNLHL